MSVFVNTQDDVAMTQEPAFPHPACQVECFQFGLEAEFLLVDTSNYSPLWHQQLSFHTLNTVLEGISFSDLAGDFSALELEAPHRTKMPFVVEGYHVPDGNFKSVDILPKGVEIRTPVCASIDECVEVYRTLFSRVQGAFAGLGLQLSCLSHHPTEFHFQGHPNKRRYDYWQWAMEVMTTYGPDINISVPRSCLVDFCPRDFEQKVNYYSPAIAALSAGSPFLKGAPWRIDNIIGKSYRTHRRSVIAPPLELHGDEDNRFEFKVCEMTPYLADFHGYFLLCLTLILDDGLHGRTDKATRIYEMGAVARHGIAAAGIDAKLAALFSRAPGLLARYGFDAQPLAALTERWQKRWHYADELLAVYATHQSLEEVLCFASSLRPA